jgi:chemotaxis protein MotB
MSRRRKPAEHVSHDRWLVSYADFITLLFAFFVVLFSSSQVDKRKVGKLAEAIQGAFQNMGILQVANSRSPMVTTNPLPTATVQMIEKGKGISGRSQLPAELEKFSGDAPASHAQLDTVQNQLEQALQSELQRHEVALEAHREGLVVSLREIGFFDSGSADIRPSAEAAVRRIATVLAAQDNNIRIEGHTDNVPIHNAHFASNWELSTARATEMTRLFIMGFHFPPSRLSAAGYAEYHQAAPNTTVEGRAMNRRVDIVVLPSVPGVAAATQPGLPSPGALVAPQH